MSDYVFTSESVSEGHPDKVCDAISDAILDNLLDQDPESHVACETLATTGTVIVSGEIRSSGSVATNRYLNLGKQLTDNFEVGVLKNLINNEPSRELNSIFIAYH